MSEMGVWGWVRKCKSLGLYKGTGVGKYEVGWKGWEQKNSNLRAGEEDVCLLTWTKRNPRKLFPDLV